MRLTKQLTVDTAVYVVFNRFTGTAKAQHYLTEHGALNRAGSHNSDRRYKRLPECWSVRREVRKAGEWV